MQRNSLDSQSPLLSHHEQKEFTTIFVPASSSDPTQTRETLKKNANENGYTIHSTAAPIPGVDNQYLFGINLKLPSNSNKQSKIFSIENALKTIFIPTAALAAIFYWNYAQACVKDNECQMLVSFSKDELTQKIILTASGGAGFALTNIFFANLSANVLIDYVKNTGILKSTLSLLPYTALQVAYIIFSGLGAKDSKFLTPQVILPAISIVPAAIYSKIEAANSRMVTYAFSEFKELLNNLHEKMISALHFHEKLARESRAHYRKEFLKLQKRLHLSQERILSEPKTYLINRLGKTPNEILLENFIQDISHIKDEYLITKMIKQFPAFFVTTSFAGIFVVNIYNQMDALTHNKFLKGLVTAILGFYSSYPNYELTMPAVNTLLKLLLLKLPQSVSLSLYPKTTLAVFLASFISQVVSHAAVYSLFKDTYYGPLKDILIWVACAAIILYHAAGANNVGLSYFIKRKISDPLEELAFHLEEHLHKLKWTPFTKFLSEVENLHPDERKLLGVTTYDEYKFNEANKTVVHYEAKKDSSLFSKVKNAFCFFKSSSHSENSNSLEEEDHHLLLAKP